MENDDIRDEDTLEEEDLEQPEEDEDVEESEEEDDDDDSDEEVEDWEAEAKKWKAIASRTRRKKKKLETKVKKPVDEEVGTRLERLEKTEEKRQFGHRFGLSPEETDKVFQIDSNPSEKTLKDPFVKAGLEAIRRKNKVEDNTPSSTTKSNPLNKKDFKELPQSEKDKEWRKYMKSKGIIG